MAKKIAVLGLAGNPSAVHHRQMAEALIPDFDEVHVIPSGPRPDKPTVDDIDPIHRAVMADMTFRDLPKVRVILSDLEQATFTRTIDLEKKYRFDSEPWIVVGADLIKGGKDGRSQIQSKWKGGDELWRNANFAVMARTGYDIDQADLPPHHQLFVPERAGSSSEIRERSYKRMPLDGLVVPEVAAYIERYNLYRGTMPQRKTRLSLASPRPLLVFDPANDGAKALAEKFSALAVTDEPNVIVAIGGDGHMLHTIREHWHRRLPFVGINAGHRGYLLNDPSEVSLPDILRQELDVYQMPLLNVRYQPVTGRGAHYEDYAFNDAWVAAIDQTAWLEVKVDGKVWFEKLVGDGLLISTAAGSTGYAANMGAMPLRLDGEQEILMVGNNVSRHHHWRWAPLPINAVVDVRPLDLKKRPVKCRFDDKDVGEVFSVRFRTSLIAAAELAFSPDCSISAKRTRDFMPPAP